jgi:hypothetical protein
MIAIPTPKLDRWTSFTCHIEARLSLKLMPPLSSPLVLRPEANRILRWTDFPASFQKEMMSDYQENIFKKQPHKSLYQLFVDKLGETLGHRL